MGRYELMLSYIPLYYHTSSIFKAILQSEGEELDLLRHNIDDVRDQFFVDTATWGLDLWEQELGLAVNPALSYGERRSKVKGKIRGIGTVSKELIKSIGEAYSNGEVDVKFDGSIVITFIGVYGIPTAIEELKRQLDDIVPAHLEVIYVFTYITWNELDLISAALQEAMTWDELEVYKP